MAVANLGVKIVLEDGASAGFDALGLRMGRLGGLVGMLASGWNQLSPATKALGITAGAAALAFAGFADALKYAVDQSAMLQDAMANIAVAVDGANTAMGPLQDTLVQISDSSIYSTTQVAEAFVSLGQHGQDAQDIMAGVGQQAIYLAEATRSDTVPAANLLAQTMQLFNMKASDAKQATTDLTFAFEHGIPSVTQLQSAIAQVGPVAANMGISFHDLVPVLSLLSQDLGSGAKAGTALRYMLSSLSDPTSKANMELSALGAITVNKTAPALQQLETAARNSGSAGAKLADNFDGSVGALSRMFTQAQKINGLHTDETFFQWATDTGLLSDKLYDAKGRFIGLQGAIDVIGQAISNLNPHDKEIALQQLFNVRGGQGMSSFANDISATDNNLKNLNTTLNSYSAEKNAEIKTNTLSGTVNKLKTNFQNLFAAIGNADLGPLQQFGNAIAGLLGKMHDSSGLTGFGNAVLIVGTLASAAIAGVSGLGFSIGVLNSKAGKAATQELAKGFQALLSPLGAASNRFKSFASGVLETINPMYQLQLRLGQMAGMNFSNFGKLKLYFSELNNISWRNVDNFFEKLAGGDGILKNVGNTLAKVFIDGPFSKLDGLFEKIAGGPGIFVNLGTAISGMGSAALGAAGSLAGIAAAALPVIAIILLVVGAIATVVLLFTTFRAQGQQIVSFLGSVFGPVFNAVAGIAQKAISEIQQAWQSAQPQISKAMDELVAGFKAAEPIFKLFAIVLGVVVGTAIIVLASLVKAFLGILAPIIRVFAGVLQALGGAFTLIIGLLTFNGAKISKGWSDLWGGIGKILSGAAQAILGLVTGLVSNILKSLAGLLKGVPVIGGFVSGASNLFGKLNDGVRNLFGGSEQAAVKNNVKKTGNAIHQGMRDAASQAYIDGETLAQALVDGVYAREQQNNYEMQVYGHKLGTSLANGGRLAVGVSSPSKVFREIGMYVTQGLALGVTEGTDAVVKTTGTSMGKVVSAAKATLTGASSIVTPAVRGMHSQAIQAQAASANAAGDLTIPLVVDGKTMATVVMNRLSGQLKSNGAGRKMHSMRR